MVMLKDIDGRTALHHAVLERNLAAITMLASKGIELDEKDENGDTALHLAVDEPENLYIVKTLLELGAARHLKNDSSLTPLNIAEINSQTDKSEDLRKKFAVIAKAFRTKKFTKVANAQTAMTKSTEMGDLGAFKNALYAGGNITMVNYKNENIIHKAAWFGRLNILTSILEGPQNAQHIKGLVNSRDSAGCTPLHNAVIRNHYDMVDALMENGADPNIQDNMGMTPIMEAAFWDKVDLLELLLTRRPNLSHKDKHGRDIYEIARRRRARRCFVALRTRN